MALLLLTEWPQFRSLGWNVLVGVSKPIVIDTRNLLDPDLLSRASFSYRGMGARVHEIGSPRSVVARQLALTPK